MNDRGDMSKALAQQIAQLRLDIDAWESQLTPVRNKYPLRAIDTNVIVFFTNPEENKHLVRLLLDSGEISHYASFLAIRQFSGDLGDNYILPPHDVEVDAFLTSFKNQKFRENRFELLSRELESLIDKRAKMTNSQFDSLIKNKSDRLADLLYHAQPMLQLSRISSLFENKILQVWSGDEVVDPDRSRFWKQQLEKEPMKKGSDRHLLMRDARVLARIEAINERDRLYFVTGDTGIVRTVQQVAFEKTDEIGSKLYKNVHHLRSYQVNKELFGSEIVESLKTYTNKILSAFLDEDESLLLETSGDEADRHEVLLNFLFSESEADGPDFSKQSKKLEKSAIQNLTSSIVSARQAAQIKESLRHISDDILVKEVALRVVDGYQPIEKELEKIISEELERFDKAADTLMLGIKTDDADRRAPPALRLDSFTSASALSRRISQVKSYQTHALEQLITKVEREDPSRYTYRLCFAIANLVRGRWVRSRSEAQVALKIAEKQQDGPIDGREAYYLLALTSRRLAKSNQQLQDSQGFLKKAAMLSQQRDIRFESERVSGYITAYNFHRFQDQKLPADTPSPQLIAEEILELLEDVAQERRNDIRHACQLNLQTNFFLLKILFPQEITQTLELKQLASGLDAFMDSFQIQRPPLLTNIVLNISRYLYADLDSDSRHDLRSQIITEIDDAQTSSSYGYPYDSNRSTYFRNLVRSGED